MSYEWKCPGCGIDESGGFSCVSKCDHLFTSDVEVDTETAPCAGAKCAVCGWSGSMPPEPSARLIRSTLQHLAMKGPEPMTAGGCYQVAIPEGVKLKAGETYGFIFDPPGIVMPDGTVHPAPSKPARQEADAPETLDEAVLSTVERLVSDVNGRSGMGIDCYDEEIQGEIREAWAGIIMSKFARLVGKENQ